MKKTITVKTRDSNLNWNDTEILIDEFNVLRKITTSLQTLVKYWVIAILCVLIPVAHFVLVPLFLILGLYKSYKVFKSEGELVDSYIICSHCGTQTHLKKQLIDWPMNVVCSNCNKQNIFDI